MSLAAAFAEYLLAGSRRGRESTLEAALAETGLACEALLWKAWSSGAAESTPSEEPWRGQTVSLGSRPSAAAGPGDLWFDVVELSLMVNVDRAWLATRPTARWQMAAFIDVAPIEPREVQIAPPYQPLDRFRLVTGSPSERVTRVTAGEATLYSWFFGKGLPDLFDWQEAEDGLATPFLRELWSRSSREWIGTRLESDEGARLFVTPSTIAWDPDDLADRDLPGMVRGEYTRDDEIGFRTAVLCQTGLLERVSSWNTLAESIRLGQIIDRSLFG